LCFFFFFEFLQQVIVEGKMRWLSASAAASGYNFKAILSMNSIINHRPSREKKEARK